MFKIPEYRRTVGFNEFFDADEIRPPEENLQLIAMHCLKMQQQLEEVRDHVNMIAVPFYIVIFLLVIGSVGALAYFILSSIL